MNAPELSVEESIDALLAPPAPPATPNEALKFAFDVTYGYAACKIAQRFKPGLAFSEEGLARAASVFGWLCGLSQGGNIELANELAADFVSNLDYLAKYGGEVDYAFKYYNGEDATRKIPAYVVKLCDDGTAHGFALLWHRPLLTAEIVANHKALGRDVVTFGYDEIPHGFAFNGGLIYHGPGAGETFTCNTGSRSWGVHT
jgi:hypothetical protein